MGFLRSEWRSAACLPRQVRQLADDQRPLSFWQTVQSVLAAFFGVQSRANRERDFARGRPLHFIVIGLLATVIFVLTLVVLVQIIVRLAAP